MATSKLMKRDGRILDPLIEGFNTWVRSRILRVWVADFARSSALELTQNARKMGL